MTPRWAFCTWPLLVATLAPLLAAPQPGDVFREFKWSDGGKWQRITSPAATAPGAKQFLPNAVNTIELSQLKGATRAEIEFELLQSHAGTIGQSIRLNGGEWRPIPGPKSIPGQRGSETGAPELWLSMRQPSLDVPVGILREGKNSFEFTCAPGFDLGARWPQSLIYGVTFRVYYPATNALPSKRVIAPEGIPGRFGDIELIVEPVAGSTRYVRRVDFLARYDGYDWRGEGVADEWHGRTLFGELQHHAGSAMLPPWRVRWDPRGVPAQTRPVEVAARVEDDTGLIHFTEATPLSKFFGHSDRKLFVAHAVPPHWQTRAGRRTSCQITLPADLSRVQEARLILATWNGVQCDEIALNGTVLVRNIGLEHELSYDELTVPTGLLRPGENEFSTTSATEHHGIEVLWPGVVLLVRFAPPPTAAAK